MKNKLSSLKVCQKYPATVDDGVTMSSENETVTWRTAHRETLPQWSALAKKLSLI